MSGELTLHHYNQGIVVDSVCIADLRVVSGVELHVVAT